MISVPPHPQPESGDMFNRASSAVRLPGLSLLLVALGAFLTPAPVAPSLYSGLVWRNLGPFRAGRIAAVPGAIGQPVGFSADLPLAGLWKTTIAAETGLPIFYCVKHAPSLAAPPVTPPSTHS